MLSGMHLRRERQEQSTAAMKYYWDALSTFLNSKHYKDTLHVNIYAKIYQRAANIKKHLATTNFRTTLRDNERCDRVRAVKRQPI